MQLKGLFRLLTVDDSLMDEEFVLQSEGQRRRTEQHEIDNSDKKPFRRGNENLRLRRVRINYGEHFVSSVFASDASVPEFTPEGKVKAAEQTVEKNQGQSSEAADNEADDKTGNETPDFSIIRGFREVLPYTMSALRDRAEASGTPKQKKTWKGSLPNRIQYDLLSNRQIVDRIFHLPINADVVVRDFRIGGQHIVEAFAVFMDGLADKTVINTHILEPLMLLSSVERDTLQPPLVAWVKNALLPGNQVMEFSTWKEATENVLAGSTVIFLEGVNKILTVETKGWEHRMVGISQTESVVRGPHDAFTESFRTNTGLVRSRLRSTKLITEMMQTGEIGSTDIAIMYLEGIVNPQIVEEVKKRIKAIQIDYLPDSGLLEQFIEDDPGGIIPKVLSTERPDRVAFGISEGQVAILVGQSPYALLAPCLFWSLLQTSEDAYLRWPFGSFIRLVRILSLLIGLLLPAFYIAVTNFHPEMIPTDLMLAVAASRERVPFPVVMEVLVMEFSIELIREAGIRIPTVIGPTIGIVGALILGQAAVAAGIISPLLIIVVAVTALGSFTMPNYNLSFSIRLLRFGFIVLAATFGFYGVVLGLMVLVMHAVSSRSFGVPIMSPIAPRRSSSPDALLRGSVFKMEERPRSYWPLKRRRQAPVNRSWAPETKDSQEARATRRRQQGNPIAKEN